MKLSSLASFSLILCSVLNLVSSDRCCQINSRQLPRYELIKSNGRSNQLVISRKKVNNVDQCRKFARSEKALAFNYGLEYSDIISTDDKNGTKKSAVRMCQALQCPEIYNFTTLVRDRKFNYYSMYPAHISSDAGTLACVPSAGIFVFSNSNLNYSQAQTSCQKMNATLAHIISEERTEGVGNYISPGTPTFVGLSNRDDERLWKNDYDEPLSCFEYRAWGEGEPSHLRGCVSLVKPRTLYSSAFWKVERCRHALPFVCEISPTYQSSRDYD